MKSIQDRIKNDGTNSIAGWNYFDQIYVIGIPQSNQAQIKTNLAKGGVGKYEVVIFNPDRKTHNSPVLRNTIFPNLYGPLLSVYDIFSLLSTCDSTCKNIIQNHLDIIKMSYKNNDKTILIFEDDAIFDKRPSQKVMDRATKWLKTHPWDVFYFGYCQWPYLFSLPASRNIVKVFSPTYGQHAYALSRPGMEKILDYTNRKLDVKVTIDILTGNPLPYLKSLEPNIAIDQLIGKTIPNLKKYALFPAISFQQTDPAMHKNAFKMLPFYITFKTFSKGVEIISVILPWIVILFGFLILINVFNKKKESKVKK